MSLKLPVVIHCYAPRHAPTEGMIPLLENTARRANGKFVLAKLNVAACTFQEQH